MKTILVMNGESYWQDFFPGYEVVQKSIQRSQWVFRDGALHVGDQIGFVKPDGILWRVGAIKPNPIQSTALNLIALSGIPCVNSAVTLQQGYDRLSMLAKLRQLDLPVIPFNVVTQSMLLKNIQINFPFVVKVGNYHGGFGKVKIENEAQWQDIRDLLFISADYITIEPFINYTKDIRYLAIGNAVWAMSRAGKYWKANIETQAFEWMEPEPIWVERTQRLQQAIGADIVAIDVLEQADGKAYIVEYNDIPGLSGFPSAVKEKLATCLKEKLQVQ